MPHWKSLGKYTAQKRKYGIFLNHWDWAWMVRSGHSSAQSYDKQLHEGWRWECCEGGSQLTLRTSHSTGLSLLCGIIIHIQQEPTPSSDKSFTTTSLHLRWVSHLSWLIPILLGWWGLTGSWDTLLSKIIPCPCFHQAWAGLNITFSTLEGQADQQTPPILYQWEGELGSWQGKCNFQWPHTDKLLYSFVGSYLPIPLDRTSGLAMGPQVIACWDTQQKTEQTEGKGW